MATLRDIRRRINSVKSTQQITKAMKMVSAAKLRRAQDQILRARPYAYELRNVIGHLADIIDRDAHSLLQERDLNTAGLVVVTSDRGLCGAFNMNIIRCAMEEIKEIQSQGKTVKLVLIGRKAADFFRRRDFVIVRQYSELFNDLNFGQAMRIGRELSELYASGAIDRVSVVYNEFKSAVQQNLLVERLLPIEPESTDSSKRLNYIYEPSPAYLVDALLPRQINIQIWRILLESHAAEHGARMTAMEVATENAQEMIAQLTLFYNRVRQASITTEILEIVGGAEALKS